MINQAPIVRYTASVCETFLPNFWRKPFSAESFIRDNYRGEQSVVSQLCSHAETLPQLARLRKSTLLKIPAVGRKYASLIQEWQKRAHFSDEAEWVGEMIHEDAKRCLERRSKS